MPIGYLVTTALVAWCTLFALAAPRRRRSSPRNLRHSFGFLVNELPVVAFYWLLASTLLAAAQGDLDTPVGWVGFALAMLATLGLAGIAWRGLHAGEAVERALAEGLGPGWRAAVDPDLAAGLRRRLPFIRILLWPFPVLRRDVERVPNIPYGDAGRRNLLDVYRHRSRPKGCPALVYLHGGGFRSGRKNREARPLLHRLASQGWVCIGANYRLSPAATFPHHLVDVKKVFSWVREHGHEYGADPTVLFVAGSSAGAHLASMAALTPNDARFQPGFEHADTSVTAAICLYGYYGSVGSGTPPSSPQAYVGPDAPPFFIAHGDRDMLVLVEDARQFAAQLRRASSHPVVYAELPSGQHSFDLFHSIRFEAVVDAIEAFAAWVLSPGPEARSS